MQPLLRRFGYASFLLASTCLPLAACDDGSDNNSQTIYTTYQQCLEANDAATCTAAMNAARTAQLSQAPHVATLTACEQQYGAGNCQSGGGGSYFMPMMMGFMLGQAMSGDRYHYHSYPVYYSSRGTVYTGRTVVTTLPPGTTISRGGFGHGSSITVTPGARSGVSSGFSSRGGYGGSVSRGGFGSSASSHGFSSGG